MKKILITGGAGYIGSMLSTELVKLRHKVTVIDDLRYSENSINHLHFFENFKFIKGDARNKKLINNYLKKNEKLLKKIFDEKFISWVQKSHEKGIPTSRVYKLICLIFKKNWIRLYDVLIPMSVIATLKNFEKFPYKKIKPRNINIFNY